MMILERKGRYPSVFLEHRAKITISISVLETEQNIDVLVKGGVTQYPVYNLVSQNMLGHLPTYFSTVDDRIFLNRTFENCHKSR